MAETVTTPLVVERADGSIHNFQVELALTNAQRAKGLMHRKELAPDAGMIFIFRDERMHSFWMSNTLIPLDIIFIKKNGRIVNIEAMAKPLDEGPRYSSIEPSRAVLEIPGGRAKELGIKPGDIIRHAFLGNMKADNE